MGKLNSIVSTVIDRMYQENRVVEVSGKASSSIDNELAIGLKQVKSEFQIREKNSRALVAKMESSSLSI